MRPNEAGQVLELVSAALERAPEARSEFLDQACAEDGQLRAEVESLLSQEQRVGDFIKASPAALTAEAFKTAGNDPFLGRRIGSYRLLRRIGHGGMGAVYLAERDDQQYRKQVAIKLISFSFDSDEAEQRFRHERQILATLDHPNIAKLLDGGTTDEGLPYFVMELIDGLSLDQYCAAQKLTMPERLELFRTVCSAVQYAHQNLIIHRDLKPANILVTAEGIPKLLDFGIAKLLDPDPSLGLTQTLTEIKALTPDYASPEQVKGEKVTTASDVYSLGVILYELLTGAKPYRLTSQSQKELEHAITEIEPARPSTVTLANQQSAISSQKSLRGDLDNIVLKAMRKDPARRYSSAGQFSEDIRRHLEGLPVIARKDTLTYRSVKFVRRHRVAVAALSLILVSLVGGIVATLVQARTARREKVKAEAISAFLQRTLMAPDPNRHAGAPPTVKEVLDEASKKLASAQLAGQPEVRAELQRTIGITYTALGQYDLAQQNLSAALATQIKLFGEDGAETLKTAAQLATLWGGSRGDYAKATQFFKQKLPLLRAAHEKGTISADYLIGALNSLALVQRAQGDSKRAEMLLREEVALRSQVSPELQNDIGIAETVLALTLADQGKLEEAIKMVREKLAGLRGHPQSHAPELCATLTGLGSFLLENGQLMEAEANLREAEPIYRQIYDAANMQLGDNLRLQAQALAWQSHYAEAETKIAQALRIYRAASTPQYVNYPTALIVQSVIYSHTGRTAEAEKLVREAARIRSESLSQEHFMWAIANGALGEFLTAQGRFAEAESLLVRSYESLKRSQAADSPRTRLALERLVALYRDWGRPGAAKEYRSQLARNP